MKYIFAILLIFSCLLADAQRNRGDVGLGLHLGEKSGLAFNLYRGLGPTVDVLAAWNFKDYLFVNVHALYYKPLGGSEYLNFIYGPGIFLGLLDDEDLKEAIDLGLSGTGGISMVYRQLEIYFRVTPRLELYDERKVNIGGGVGVRLYF